MGEYINIRRKESELNKPVITMSRKYRKVFQLFKDQSFLNVDFTQLVPLYLDLLTYLSSNLTHISLHIISSLTHHFLSIFFSSSSNRTCFITYLIRHHLHYFYRHTPSSIIENHNTFFPFLFSYIFIYYCS